MHYRNGRDLLRLLGRDLRCAAVEFEEPLQPEAEVFGFHRRISRSCSSTIRRWPIRRLPHRQLLTLWLIVFAAQLRCTPQRYLVPGTVGETAFCTADMAETQRACGKIKPRRSEYLPFPRIGGPRDVCMKHKGHEGACGDWERMTDAEHGDVLAGRRTLELPVFDRGHEELRLRQHGELDFA